MYKRLHGQRGVPFVIKEVGRLASVLPYKRCEGEVPFAVVSIDIFETIEGHNCEQH